MKKAQIKFKWIGSNIEDPFQMIATLFDSAPPDYYKRFVKAVLLHTDLPKAYYERSTSSMLFTLKNIKQFIKVGYAIKVQELKSPLTIHDRDLFDARFYANTNDVNKRWLLRPVALTAEEYKDPYLVFKSVFEKENFKELYDRFKEAFQAACSTNAADEVDINQLELYFKLYKIIEACYLINIREVFHHEGRLKRFHSTANT